MKSFYFVLLGLLFSLAGPTYAAKKQGAFAIVVDAQVMEHCAASINKYAKAVEADGLKTHIVVDKWQVPDSIRAVLIHLYKEDNLEGAVFVGNIPVPMIRDAQHLTTAFKMDQRRAWNQSSVPSDRFYDDFDLQFTYLKQDSLRPLYHYYSLSRDGAQSVNSEIYTARIKPPVYEGKSRFELIDEYLDKVVREKQSAREIKEITFFAGQGYNSNCMVARQDEKIALSEQFNALRTDQGTVNFIDHTYDDYVKYRLMAELQRADLDLALLHHHGAEDTQYLNSTPNAKMASEWLEMARKFFRGKIRNAKDSIASKQYYIDNYNIPESWVADVFNPEIVEKDSIADASLDIHIEDLAGFAPNARFVMLDACFNGSFHLDDYISGHYIFNPGRTVVVKANSVNTLQDIWSYQLIGLLDLGVSVGNWAKELFTLESHLIGDPTYRYATSPSSKDDLNYAISHRRGDVKYWKHLLNANNPTVRSLAMKMLFHNGEITNQHLYEIQTADHSPSVRLMAYYLINQRYNDMVVPSIKAGLYDSYELIRRFSARDAATNQSPLLLEDVIAVRLSPAASKRVEFQIKRAVEMYPMEDVLALYNKFLEDKNGKWYDERRAEMERLKSVMEGKKADANSLLDSKLEAKKKKFVIRSLRNSNQVAYLDLLFSFMKESNDNDLKITMAEAFGWFTNSWKRDEIVDFCSSMASSETDEAVKNELLKTVKRLAE